jgi:hypothetical protein
MILCNDVWHITNDDINRLYFAANGTTFICGGGAGFIIYISGATGNAHNLVIKNHGDITIG